ncbi:kinesin protein KIF15 [Biomphalaria glabrata]|nr:kinesin protein KIF15 [Biomphalaria glabrata]
MLTPHRKLVGKKIIEDCLKGYNGSILAYGQTGSGKSFTMFGPSENLESSQLRGVIPRSLEYLFSVIAHQQDHGSKNQFLCRCSFLEIYQEQIFDLLDTASQGIRLRENMNKGVFVDGLIEQVICNPRDAYQLIIKGWLNHRVALTSMNREGSRSHAVFTVKIESKEEVSGFQKSNISQINLIDLAGSERQKATNTDSTRLKKLYAVISKLQQENQNLLEKLIFMNHLENHESQLTAKEEELQRVNMTRQKFEKDNKVLQAMLKHTEVCEQKAPEVPNFQVIKKIELAYSRKMEEFERSIFGKDKKVAELLFEVAKLKEELHLARETHASVLKDRNCNKMDAEFQCAVPMQGGAIGEPGERKSSSEKNGSVRGRTLIKETKMPEINEQSWRSKKSE